MKYSFLFTITAFFTYSCYGQSKLVDTAAYAAKIEIQGNNMGRLLVEKRFKAFCKFVYPVLIGKMGGQKKMIADLEKGFLEMEKEGTGFISATIGRPSQIFSEGRELQCVVPEILLMKVPGGKLVSISYLVAISANKGKHWYFTDTPSKTIEVMRETMPNLSSELTIPKKGEPVFYGGK